MDLEVQVQPQMEAGVLQMNKKKFKCTTLGGYQIIKTLGQGATCKVKLGRDQNGKFYALKILKGKWALDDKQTKTEVEILQKLNHENIINVVDLQTDAIQIKPSGKKSKKTFIVLELAEGGELFDYLSATGKFQDNICRYYFKQLLNALNHCHNNGFCHRDLKPENLFFSKVFQLKLADFGFSSLLDKEGDGKLYTMLGTRGYMAPEICEQKPYDGKQVDLFAAGVILFIMKAGIPPFGEANLNDPYYKLFNRKARSFWKVHGKQHEKGFYSKEYQDLLNKMLTYEPKDRLDIQDIAQHSWLTGDTATEEEVIVEFNRRSETIKAQKASQLENQRELDDTSEDESYQQVGAFRDIETEVLEKLNLTNSYENLAKNYKGYKSEEREATSYVDTGKCLNTYQIKAKIQDVFEFLICVFDAKKKECDTISLDEEEYIINVTIQEEKGPIGFLASIYEQNEGQCIIEFRKTQGDQNEFFKTTKDLKETCLDILAKSEQEPKKQKVENQEENQQEK